MPPNVAHVEVRGLVSSMEEMMCGSRERKDCYEEAPVSLLQRRRHIALAASPLRVLLLNEVFGFLF